MLEVRSHTTTSARDHLFEAGIDLGAVQGWAFKDGKLVVSLYGLQEFTKEIPFDTPGYQSILPYFTYSTGSKSALEHPSR